MPSGELSTRSIVHDALRNGKEVFIPYLHKVVSPLTQQKSSIMDMLALESIEEFESLEPDRWGIPSLKPSQVVNKKNCLGGYGVCPQGGDEATEDGHGLDLIVMPGMAFDHGFRRLGHGKGYYDLFLTRYSEKKARSKTTTSKMPFLGERPSLCTIFWTNKKRTSSNKIPSSFPLPRGANASSHRGNSCFGS